MEENRWLDWAIEPQSLAQAGLPFETVKGFSAMRPAIRRRSPARALHRGRRCWNESKICAAVPKAPRRI